MKALGGGAAAAVTLGGATTVASAQTADELDSDRYEELSSEPYTLDDTIDPEGSSSTRQNLVDFNEEWGEADVIHVEVEMGSDSDAALLMFLPSSADYEEWRNYDNTGTYDQVYATPGDSVEFTFNRDDIERAEEDGSRFYVAIVNPDTSAVRSVQGEVTITRYEELRLGEYRGFFFNDPDRDLLGGEDGQWTGLEMGAAFGIGLAAIEIGLHLVEIHRHG